jgi:flavodoxin
MKTAIIYYSLSSKTRELAKLLANRLKADLIEIKDKKTRKGLFGFLRSGYESVLKKNPEINVAKSIDGYDLLILGTPVWAGTIASPMHAFISENIQILKNKKLAFIATHAAKDEQKAFTDMEKAIGKKPVTTYGLCTSGNNSSDNQKCKYNIDRFIQECQHGKSPTD